MQLKKEFNFLMSLPIKLNSFYTNKLKSKIVIKNKSKDKKDFDPVTNLDQAFEKYIRSLIYKKFPYDAIIGEEFKDKKSTNEFSWCIDPIDGTKALVIGAPTWSNLIGFSFKDKPIFGLVNFPELNRHYINDGNKSYLYKKGKKFILKSSNNHNLNKIKIIGNFHESINSKKQKKIIKKFKLRFRTTSLDALSYCLLAEGKVDAVLEANLKPHDILPLIPIIENSRAIVTNWNNKSAKNGGNILASSNRKLHNKILRLLKPFVKKND